MSKIISNIIIIFFSSAALILAGIAGAKYHLFVFRHTEIEIFGIAYFLGAALIEEMMRMIGIIFMICLIDNRLKFYDFMKFGLLFGSIEFILKSDAFFPEIDSCIENCWFFYKFLLYTYVVALAPVFMHILVSIRYISLFLSSNVFLSIFVTLIHATVLHTVFNFFATQMTGSKFPITEFPLGTVILILLYVWAIYFAWLKHRKSLRPQSGQ